MTIAWLVLALLVVSLAVNPVAQALMWRLKSHHQVGIGVTASLALVVLPIAAVLVALSGGLAARGGSLLSRCGRLVAAVVLEPWARPELTLSLFLLAFMIARLTWGMARAWRSQSAAVRLAAEGDGLQVVVPAPQCFVFTVGLLKPRIVLSEGFLRSTPQQWRRVVLAHEEAHARGRHPLILFIVEAISAALPLAPMRWAAQVTRSGLEAVADDYATRKVGDRRIVAEVIAGMALTPVYGAIGFEGDEVRRVRRLLNAVTSVRLDWGNRHRDDRLHPVVRGWSRGALRTTISAVARYRSMPNRWLRGVHCRRRSLAISHLFRSAERLTGFSPVQPRAAPSQVPRSGGRALP